MVEQSPQSPANSSEPPAAPALPPDEVSVSSLSEAAAPAETQQYPLGVRKKEKSPEAASLPAAFGRYQVQSILGSGGFGTVFLGHDRQLDRPVAIKAQRPGSGAQDLSLEECLQEARRLARLRHPGIVAVHDVGCQDEHVYIVSDFVAGKNLHAWLAQQRPAWQEAVRIVAQVAEALAHAHANRTIHRDVKPANIILTDDGNPVLVDFGLGLDDTTGHQLGVVSGTPSYMSPEQASGLGHRIDGRTDIFSLGVVLYEMLTGRQPFRATATDELLRQIRDDEPQPPRQLVPSLPRALEQICHKALAKRMGDRFSTAGDLAEELWRLLRSPNFPIAEPAKPAAPESTSAARVEAGKPTSSSAGAYGPREPERRQLTLLTCACDLFDSEAFLENLPFPEQRELLKSYQRICHTIVEHYKGVVLQTTNQEVLACFGYPVALEDAAPRAVRSGLEILKDLAVLRERLQREKGLSFSASVGVHTGMAVVSQTADESGATTLSVVGEPRNVVARLDHVVQPDAVVLSQATHRLIQGYFQCASLGTFTVKGLAQPLEFFKVTAENESPSRIERSDVGQLTPLIGRDLEVGLLQDRWEQALEGRGQVVLLVGEAGLGKSRLVLGLKERVNRDDPDKVGAVIEWRCSAYCQNSGLFPAIDFLGRWLRFQREDDAAARLGKLRGHLLDLGLTAEELLPLFAALLFIAPEGGYIPLDITPTRQKEKTLNALLEWLRALAARRPVVFTVEDLHWVDPSTLDFLALQVERAAQERMLTLLTFRPEFALPWKNLAQQTVVALNRLTRRQVADLMQRQTGLKQISPALVEQIVARTDGVPLFVEEFTKMMVEAGHFRHDGAVTDSMLSQKIPATLQDLLMARLDRLASNRDVVQLAATVGREFSHEFFGAVAALDESALQVELAKLVKAEILYQKCQPPRCTYSFKHALIQDAAYQSMLKPRRQQYHRRIAEVLEQRFAEQAETQPEILAQHFTEAGLLPQGIAAWAKAGLRSRDRSANAEAVSQLRRGLELLATLGPTPERVAQELQMQLALGTALIASRGFAAPEVGPVFARARTQARQTGDHHALLAVIWGSWAWHVVREELDRCLQLGDEALQAAHAQADPGMLAEAHFIPGLTLFYRGDFAGSRDHCQQGLALYDAERCRQWASRTGQNSGVTHRCYLALSLWHLGYPDQALRVGHEAVDLARALGHHYSLAYALHHLGWLQQCLRDGRAVQASADAELKIATDHGFAFWRATAHLCRAAGCLLDRRPAEALERSTPALAAFRGTGAELSLAHYFSYLAEAHRQLGQFDQALSRVNDGLAAAAKNRNEFFLPELHRLKGEILLASPGLKQAEAEACFEEALATATRQQAKSWELRTAMSLGRLRVQQGRRDEARQRLGDVLAWFTEGFSTPDLLDAKALLEVWR